MQPIQHSERGALSPAWQGAGHLCSVGKDRTLIWQKECILNRAYFDVQLGTIISNNQKGKIKQDR